MDRTKTFTDFLAAQSAPIPILDFEINLALTALLAFLLGRIYVRYGLAISNRELFANNFVLLATITMVVITIVKSSLALSLGLVGALSIVRFRAAIKEPEELSYLFFAICIGLGMGADQRAIVLLPRHDSPGHLAPPPPSIDRQPEKSLYLSVSLTDGPKFDLAEVTELLSQYCSYVDLRRYDDQKDAQDAAFAVSFPNIEALENAKNKLKEIDEGMTITFMDQSGIFN